LRPTLPAAASDPPADPIFDLIEKHRVAVIGHEEAVGVEFAYEKNRTEVEQLQPRERKKNKRNFRRL
jgi:hypothetical protein